MNALLTLVLIACISVFARAEILLNHDFESTPLGTQWLPQGATTPTYPAEGDPNALDALRRAKPGVRCMRMTGRQSVSDSVYQDIFPLLPAVPNPAGEPYCFRLHIKTDDAAFVRLILQFRYAVPGQPGSSLNQADVPVILAEKVIRPAEAGQWLDVEGVKKLQWPVGWLNGPNKCVLRVEVGQLYKERLLQATPSNPSAPAVVLPVPAGAFPGFRLDFISMQPDSDLDGLSDNDEVALVPAANPLSADSDGDGLPDKWEFDHGLAWAPPGGQPLSASNNADGDADGDGFTNREEYWAATDPGKASSYPGQTANPNATAAARQMAKFMALLPSRPAPQRLVGQMVSDPAGNIGNGSQPWQTYAASIDGLANLTGRHPAMIATGVEGISTAVGLPLAAPLLRSYSTQGGLVVVKWSMWNPWTLANSGSQGVLNQVDIPGLIDPASPNYGSAANAAARVVFTAWVNTVAVELAKFVDPAFGGHPDNVVIFRPLSEMNGNWFWFGHRSREEFLGLWKYLFDDFNARGLNHLLWCYESAQSEHYFTLPSGSAAPSDYYYPGDALVDIMGHNLYDDDWVLPHDFNALYRAYPKIYGVPQAGPGSPGLRDGSFDNRTYLNRIAAGFPRMSFFVAWDTFQTGATGINHLSIVDNAHAVELMTDPRAITLESFAWKTPWQQWAQSRFGTLATPLTGDWDGDGLSNGLEYGFGTDPLQATAMPMILALPNPVAPLSLSFHLDASAGVNWTIEGSSDLAQWLPLATRNAGGSWSSPAGGVTTESAAGAVLFTDSVLPGAVARRFLRLRITLP